MAIRIGVNPIGWTNDDLDTLGDDTPLEVCLAEARQAGYAGIELGRKFPRRSAELRAVLEPHGLDLVSGWYGSHLLRRSAKEEIAALEAHAGLLAALGATAMVFAEETGSVHGRLGMPLSARPRVADGDWPRFGEALTEVAEHLAGRGMRLAYHHHMGTVVETEAEIDRLMQATGPPWGSSWTPATSRTRAGTCRRSRDVTRAGSSTSTARTSGRPCWRRHAGTTGASSTRWSAGYSRCPATGPSTTGALLEILRGAGYAGWLVVEAEQDPVKAHPLTYARMGFAHLSRLLADLRM